MALRVISCLAAKPDEFCPHCYKALRLNASECDYCHKRIRRPKRQQPSRQQPSPPSPPSPRTRRRSCRHIQYRIWCRICVRSNRHYRSHYDWRPSRFHLRSRWHQKHPGQRHPGGFQPLQLRRSKSAQLPRRVFEMLEYTHECRTIRLLLFREGMGALKNLSPRDADRVRAFRNKRYDDYLTRMQFQGKEPLSLVAWNRRWWGGLKGLYIRWDVPQLMKAAG
jgi:hypothetical protein